MSLGMKSTKQFKKGEIGQKLVKKYLENKGFIVYEPTTDGAHAFDIVAIRNKQEIIIAEIKTKPAMFKYPATGINKKHYLEYKKICSILGIDIFLFFVDEKKKKIYGNFLNALEEAHYTFPKEIITKHGDVIRLFPLSAMIEIASLSDEICKQIIKLSSYGYEY